MSKVTHVIKLIIGKSAFKNPQGPDKSTFPTDCRAGCCDGCVSVCGQIVFNRRERRVCGDRVPSLCPLGIG